MSNFRGRSRRKNVDKRITPFIANKNIAILRSEVLVEVRIGKSHENFTLPWSRVVGQTVIGKLPLERQPEYLQKIAKSLGEHLLWNGPQTPPCLNPDTVENFMSNDEFLERQALRKMGPNSRRNRGNKGQRMEQGRSKNQNHTFVNKHGVLILNGSQATADKKAKERAQSEFY